MNSNIELVFEDIVNGLNWNENSVLNKSKKHGFQKCEKIVTPYFTKQQKMDTDDNPP